MDTRTNGDVWDWLLAEDTGDFPPAPPGVLADWVEAIPLAAARRLGRKAILRRFGINHAPAVSHGTNVIGDWRQLPFRPPVYSTDEETGERLRLSDEFVIKNGLLETGPQKVYSMPQGLAPEQVMAWLSAEPPYEDREAYAAWFDDQGREYEMVNGRLVLKPRDGCG